MKIDIITLFPGMFKGPFDMSMLWKAQERGLVEIHIHDLRQYGLGPRRQVDDTPYGGGDGMVLKPEPIFAAVEHIQSKVSLGSANRRTERSKVKSQKSKVVIMSPRGQRFQQSTAAELAQQTSIILICGHYEGFDERILSLADYELSIGDYVLTGGELPAMVVTDAVVRLLPGVLGGEQSAHDESFSHGLLEYPQYTRPEEFRGMRVPDVLQSGHHAEIDRWRQTQAINKTKANRPDLLS